MFCPLFACFAHRLLSVRGFSWFLWCTWTFAGFHILHSHCVATCTTVFRLIVQWTVTCIHWDIWDTFCLIKQGECWSWPLMMISKMSFLPLRPGANCSITCLFCFRPVWGGSWGTRLGLHNSASWCSYVLLVVLQWADHQPTSCNLAAGRSWCLLYWLWQLRRNWHCGHKP